MTQDKYPPGFGFMAEPAQQDAEERINGFARGDRIQVINKDSKYYGKFGRVLNSWAGCIPEECAKNRQCALVEVTLEGTGGIPGYSRSPVLNPHSLTHVD